MQKKIFFLSDIHLGAKYIENGRSHERKIVSLLEKIGEEASEIYLLGDILDYWFEYKTVVPRGYVRFFGALAKLADAGVKISWMTGNHDIWIFDYLRDELGIEVLYGPVTRDFDGKVFYLAHGDDLGKYTDKSFKIIRSFFRNKVCQKLYSGIHPRWTVPFAHRWSSGSRKSNGFEYIEWSGDKKEPAYRFVKDYLKDVNPEINYFILGHRHLLVDKELSETCRLVILGDCYEQFTYAVWDGRELRLEHFDSESN